MERVVVLPVRHRFGLLQKRFLRLEYWNIKSACQVIISATATNTAHLSVIGFYFKNDSGIIVESACQSKICLQGFVRVVTSVITQQLFQFCNAFVPSFIIA